MATQILGLALLRRRASIGAARLVRQFRLPPHEHDDLQQDFLVDLIARLKSFDPTRGSLGAFASTVVVHRSGRLAAHICRERSMFAPISLDDPQPDSDGITVGDTIAESSGYLAMMGQQTDRFASVDRRLDLDRALGTLRRSDRELCGRLVDSTPNELSGEGQGSRASIYRQMHEIRLQIMTRGVSAAA